MKKIAVLLCAAFLVAACAGTPINWTRARSVTVGMTDKQLAEIMGSPYMVSSQGDRQVWIYSHADAFAGTKSVSFVMKDGKVVGVPTITESFK